MSSEKNKVTWEAGLFCRITDWKCLASGYSQPCSSRSRIFSKGPILKDNHIVMTESKWPPVSELRDLESLKELSFL